MDQELVEKIKQHPDYNALISKRSSFVWILSVVMLVIYYTFILIIAFNPSVFAMKLSEGSVITLGIPVGVAVILSAFILTGIYVYRANGEFDRLTNKIKEDIK